MVVQLGATMSVVMGCEWGRLRWCNYECNYECNYGVTMGQLWGCKVFPSTANYILTLTKLISNVVRYVSNF